MRSTAELKLIFGILIWIGLTSTGILFMRNALKDVEGGPYKVAQFLATPHRTVELEFTEKQVFRVGTPIFCQQNGVMAPVGRVVRFGVPNPEEKKYLYTDRAFAEFFAGASEIQSADYLMFHEAPDSFAWVMEVMLSQQTREEIGDLILSAFTEHQREIVAAFRPIVEDSIREASEILREDLKKSLANHEADFSRLGQKFQTDLIEKEIVPLVRNEIWPLVQIEAEPLVTEIGQQLWNEVSLWRFTWKYLYDRAPLPERNLAENEFRRFVNNKVVPVIESRIGEIIKVQQRILQEVAQNEKVKETVAKSFRKIMADKEVQALVTEIFREVFVDNPRLHEVLEKNWNGPKAQAALAMTNTRLEPTITGIGQILFGSPDGQITPEFSRVLRSRILNKDLCWMTYHFGEAESADAEKPMVGSRVMKVFPGGESADNPFHIPANLGFDN